jgi:hypothetical protein
LKLEIVGDGRKRESLNLQTGRLFPSFSMDRPLTTLNSYVFGSSEIGSCKILRMQRNFWTASSLYGVVVQNGSQRNGGNNPEAHV